MPVDTRGTASATSARRRRRRPVWVPVHRTPRPTDAAWDERAACHARIAGAGVGVVVAVVVGLWTGSAPLAVFWMFVAGDAAAALLSSHAGDGFARHLVVVTLTTATAVTVLLVTVGAWGRGWWAVVAALAAAGVVRGVTALLVAPSLIFDPATTEFVEHERELLS